MRRLFPLFLLLLTPFYSACDNAETEDIPVIIEDIEVGTGPVIQEKDALMVSYRGMLEDGSVFQTSDDLEPFAFTVGVGNVIEGWDEGLIGMQVGGTRRLTIPPSKAFGSSGVCRENSCPVPANATVIFEITVLRRLDTPHVTDELIGTGAEARAGLLVSFTYIGTLPNGNVFASSQSTGQVSQMVIGDDVYIPGLEQGIIGMRAGGLRKIIIPPHLGYGETGYGGIPPWSVLKFRVELTSVAN